MTISSRILRCALVFLTLLTGQGSSSGQTLYDVVISLSDRQRVVNQRNQVAVYLRNQTNDPGGVDQTIPEDQPIDWQGVGGDPTQSAVDGLGIGGKIALLNQAVYQFEILKDAFLNSSPGEFVQGQVVGTLQSYAPCDFDPMPRATPENFQELLRLMAQRVRALRLIEWTAAFHTKSVTDGTNVYEYVAYRDPDDANNDGNREPYVKLSPEGTLPSSVNWKPGQIGSEELDRTTTSFSTMVSGEFDSKIAVAGSYGEYTSSELPDKLRSQSFAIGAQYAEKAEVRAAAPGSSGGQIDGTVYILSRGSYHELDVTGGFQQFDKDQAGYVVEGGASSGMVTLISGDPQIMTKGHYAADGHFVQNGYHHDESQQIQYNGSYPETHYEDLWNVGCDFHSVFKPDFTRGVDAAGMQSKLRTADTILADNTEDGALLIQPRPELLFGIQLGPGLKGAGNGFVSCGSPAGSQRGLDSMPRFDSTYSLQFAGSCSDYHVVFENERSERDQVIDWGTYAFTQEILLGGVFFPLPMAWDTPRLKQIAGRDLVADIEYNSSHYGGYTVRVYRRTTGSAAPTPGQVLSTSGMPLIRTWTFSHPGAGTSAHLADAEKLEVSGSGGEKYEITANHILSNEEWNWYYGAGPPHWYEMEGSWSWTLKALKGTSEKHRREIEITTLYDEDWGFLSDVILSEDLDGQQISTLSSMTLDPFSAQVPTYWQITSAGKTITGSAVLGAWNDPASGYGKWPTSVSIEYDGFQPDADFTWDATGLLASVTQGPWTTTGTATGDTHTLTQKLNGATCATTWIELSEGGNKVKTSSSANGASGAPVAWTEVEYGTATTGLPGLPHIVRNSDGSGATYQWEWISPSNENQLTLTAGLISGSSVSRGSRIVRNTDEHGHSTGSESFLINGGTIETGGSVLSAPNAWGAPTKSTDYNTGLTSTWAYDNNLSRLSTHTGSLGVLSEFSGYDVLGRPATVSHNGISAANTYNAFSTTSVITGSATGNLAETRDALGRLTRSNHTWNGVTDDLTITPGSATVITREQTLLGTHTATLRQNDGTLTASAGPTQPFGGTAGTALTVDNGLLKSTSNLADQTAAYQTTWTDAWGRLRKTETPNGPTNILYSDPTSTLQRVRVTEPTGRKLITESDPYSSSGAITRSGIDVNGNGELGATDRYVESITTVTGGNLVTTLSLTENGGLREILRTAWNPDGNETVTKINGNEETITRKPDYANKTVKTTSSKGWEKNESFNKLGLTTSSNLTGAGVPAATLTPDWRADGSLAGVTFTTGGDTHSATFNPNGTLATLTAPGKGNILGGHSISGGQETLTVDGITTVTKLDGTQSTTSGSDVPNKTETLATSGSGFKSTTTPTAGAATEVVLNAAGAPTAKNYAAGAGEARDYYTGGLLKEITLARGGKLTFGYSSDGAKDLTSATWPAVASGSFMIPAIVQGYGHDRAGRVDEIGDSSGARSIIYQNGRPKQTVWNSGALAGYKIVRGLDTSGRETGFELWRGSVMIHAAQSVPNGVSGEVSSVTASGFSAILGRNGARNLESITRGAVTQRWQRGTAGRILLADTNNTVSGAPSFNYKGTANDEGTAFDSKGRRLKCATAGGEWVYQYTNGRLTRAEHKDANDNIILGDFNYGFDGIGRRTDKGSANTSDLLNRTLAWENSQNKTVKVNAHPAAQVWFNGTQIPNFTGSYNHPVPSPGPAGGWFAWNTLAVLPGQGDAGANPDAKAQRSGAVWVPPVNESFTFDAAGNRESSALWDFGWDAKNNLVRARTKNYNSAVQGYDINNAYDSERRRFSKKVNRYQNGQVVEQKVITFIHDGNDIVYEREQHPSGLTICERKYVWGPDISGTRGGAGGAGGLLLIRETKGNVTIDLYPLYDGSGNVIALADNTGTLKAEYGYGPFGEPLFARGPNAQSCPFRFQTKYLDQETSHYCYLLRIYDPLTAQFLSRDPLGEKVDLNLYLITGGDPINYVDVDGLAPHWMTDTQGKVYDEHVREWMRSGNFNSNMSAEIFRVMAMDGVLPDTSEAEGERLGAYYGSVGKVALNNPGYVSTAGVLSSLAVGIIQTIPGTGPVGDGAGDGSNTTGALIFDTFRLNANSLIALGNPGSSSVGNSFAEFNKGYNKKYSYGQRSFAQGASLAAAVLMPEAVMQGKAALANGPGWSVKLAPRLNPLNYRVAAGELYSGVPRLRFSPGSTPITWQKYEKTIRGIYGESSFSARQFSAIVDGKLVNGIADNVTEIAGRRVAVEAKYVNDWSSSLRNPASPIGNRPWAIAEQVNMLDQAKKYSAGFEEVIYHSNSLELINYYTNSFRNAGISNFQFILTK